MIRPNQSKEGSKSSFDGVQNWWDVLEEGWGMSMSNFDAVWLWKDGDSRGANFTTKCRWGISVKEAPEMNDSEWCVGCHIEYPTVKIKRKITSKEHYNI